MFMHNNTYIYARDDLFPRYDKILGLIGSQQFLGIILQDRYLVQAFFSNV